MHRKTIKTTVEIPSDELDTLMKNTNAKTKKQAIVIAIAEYNRRRRLSKLAEKLGTFSQIMSVDELKKQRRAK
ncbi:MAG: DUF2191 domain-containing protein [Deltaproteobacteria bacterium]|nr:DUF2191 domain-containing protein [Deltaproteobacteria bacterium]